MSHITDIDLVIDDLGALEQAAEACGLEFAAGQDTYRWYGRHVGDYPMPAGFAPEDLGKCSHAIKVPGRSGAYEIGVVRRRNEDGSEAPGWTLLYDFWGNHGRALTRLAGHGREDVGKLLQEYSAARVQKTIRGASRIKRKKLEDGTLRLTIQR